MAGFDGKGQKVITLLDDMLDANRYEVVWDGKDEEGKKVMNGLYFYRIQTNNFNKKRK